MFYQYKEPPTFTTPPPDAINASGIRELVRVNCSATGAPLPNITWYKNNVTIPSTYYANSDEVTGELLIDQFQPLDQATYTCIAHNMYKDEVKTSTKIGTMLIQLTLSSFKSLTKPALLLLNTFNTSLNNSWCSSLSLTCKQALRWAKDQRYSKNPWIGTLKLRTC